MKRTADQSTQSAPDDEARDGGEADVIARRRAAKETPRRYDEDADIEAGAEAEDPALPADDATLKTKI